MSSDEVQAKARETLRSMKELLKAVKTSAHRELEKNAPKVVNTLDRSFEKASNSLTDTLGVIDKKTTKEQLELLKAYRSFLQKQTQMIQTKITSLEREPKAEPK
jgi:DnaJ-domain-containing protein 1